MTYLTMLVLFGCGGADLASKQSYQRSALERSSAQTERPHEVSEGYSYLKRASVVESRFVGFAGATSEGFDALVAVMRSSAAREHLDALLAEAQPAGKAYALVGLEHLDPEGQSERIAAYADDPTPIELLIGCIGGRSTLGGFVEENLDQFEEELAVALETGE